MHFSRVVFLILIRVLGIKTNHPVTSVPNPNPPAIFSNVSACSAAAGVVAYPTWKSAAATKAKRNIRQKNAMANGTFVRRAPVKNKALIILLHATIRI